MRNFLTLLLISQGVPFLSHGDEFGRTQHGNNNAYCQDNEISWVDWGLAQKNAGLLRFTRMMIALRKRFFAINREEFVRSDDLARHTARQPGLDRKEPDPGVPDAWLARPAGTLRDAQRPLGVTTVRPPTAPGPVVLERLVDTVLPSPEDIAEEANAVPVRPVDHYYLSARSMVILISA